MGAGLLEELLVGVRELVLELALLSSNRLVGVGAHLLPLGLQFSLSSEIRLHGYAPLRRGGGDADRRSVIYRCNLLARPFVDKAMGRAQATG